jgi:hypothetical protein
MEKPEILSDKQIEVIVRRTFPLFELNEEGEEDRKEATFDLLAKQRDADVAYYKPLIQQAEKDAMRRHQSWLANVKGWRNPEQIKELLEQAQQEVAREVDAMQEELIEEIKKALLTSGEQYALFLQYEEEHPLQDVNWEDILLQAQLQKIIKRMEDK